MSITSSLCSKPFTKAAPCLWSHRAAQVKTKGTKKGHPCNTRGLIWKQGSLDFPFNCNLLVVSIEPATFGASHKENGGTFWDTRTKRKRYMSSQWVSSCHSQIELGFCTKYSSSIQHENWRRTGRHGSLYNRPASPREKRAGCGQPNAAAVSTDPQAGGFIKRGLPNVQPAVGQTSPKVKPIYGYSVKACRITHLASHRANPVRVACGFLQLGFPLPHFQSKTQHWCDCA